MSVPFSVPLARISAAGYVLTLFDPVGLAGFPSGRTSRMLLIPAIDIKDGKCVRLRQGRMDDPTVFSEDPVGMASRWVDEGARRLHIVDLDGARDGRPGNISIIKDIAVRHPDVPIQIGGGIRDDDTIQQYLDCGVQYVILGTKAVVEPHLVPDVCAEFPGHIIVGLDSRHGKVAVEGWSKLSSHDVIDLAQRFEQDGVEAIVYTDIGRDGDDERGQHRAGHESRAVGGRAGHCIRRHS